VAYLDVANEAGEEEQPRHHEDDGEQGLRQIGTESERIAERAAGAGKRFRRSRMAEDRSRAAPIGGFQDWGWKHWHPHRLPISVLLCQ
jgi:hypothetical protein